MRYDILKIIVFHTFSIAVQMLILIYTLGKPWFLQWHIPWLINAILLKLGGVTVGTHTYQYCNIQVARGSGCFHEIIRIIKLCDWPERSPKVKSAMAQYLKIHSIRYTNYVSFMLLSKSAQFFAMPPHYLNIPENGYLPITNLHMYHAPVVYMFLWLQRNQYNFRLISTYIYLSIATTGYNFSSSV